MKLLKIRKFVNSTSIDFEIDIPFTNGDKWVELNIERRKWLELQIKEIYEVTNEDAKRVLGDTDNRLIFNLGFRIPFVKEDL